MGKLYCLMGKSAAGKDSIYAELLKRKKNLKKVVTYTTRPMRSGEREGVEYHFVSEEIMRRMHKEDRIIECREYPTVYGPWFYFTADDGQINPDTGSYLMIGTLDAYVALRKRYGEAVVPIYVETDDGERLARALERERSQKEPKYEELCRRFLADAVDFSEKRIEEAGITVRYKNEDFSHCVEEIIKNMVQ